jgi:hypothetical protein
MSRVFYADTINSGRCATQILQAGLLPSISHHLSWPSRKGDYPRSKYVQRDGRVSTEAPDILPVPTLAVTRKNIKNTSNLHLEREVA